MMKMFGKKRVVQVKSKATLMEKEESQSSGVSEVTVTRVVGGVYTARMEENFIIDDVPH